MQRWNALLEAEHVFGVVLGLDRAQSVDVGSPIGGLPVRHAGIGNVDVGAIHVRLQRLAELGNPGLALRSQRVGRCGYSTASAPAGAWLRVEQRVSVGKR